MSGVGASTPGRATGHPASAPAPRRVKTVGPWHRRHRNPAGRRQSDRRRAAVSRAAAAFPASHPRRTRSAAPATGARRPRSGSARGACRAAMTRAATAHNIDARLLLRDIVLEIRIDPLVSQVQLRGKAHEKTVSREGVEAVEGGETWETKGRPGAKARVRGGGRVLLQRFQPRRRRGRDGHRFPAPTPVLRWAWRGAHRVPVQKCRGPGSVRRCC